MRIPLKLEKIQAKIQQRAPRDGRRTDIEHDNTTINV